MTGTVRRLVTTVRMLIPSGALVEVGERLGAAEAAYPLWWIRVPGSQRSGWAHTSELLDPNDPNWRPAPPPGPVSAP